MINPKKKLEPQIAQIYTDDGGKPEVICNYLFPKDIDTVIIGHQLFFWG